MPVLLYTRRGCHLCERAEDMLAANVLPGAVEIVDIDAQPDLQRRYGTRVPVLSVAGADVLEGRFEEADLVRILHARRPVDRVTGPASVPADQASRRVRRPT